VSGAQVKVLAKAAVEWAEAEQTRAQALTYLARAQHATQQLNEAYRNYSAVMRIWHPETQRGNANLAPVQGSPAASPVEWIGGHSFRPR
jgi:hypothetical protein